MDAALEGALRAMLDRKAITRLIHAYCRAVDRKDVAACRELYHSDAMENMGIFTAAACAIVLLRRLTTSRFTDLQLVALIFFQMTEFGVIATYYVSGLQLDMSDLGGFWGITIKYIGSDIFWLVMSCVVFYWAGQLLLQCRAEAVLANR